MYLARVIGQVVSSKKDEKMTGRKLVLVRPQLIDADDATQFKGGGNTIVAVDSLGAGQGDMVLFCQGSSARQTSGMKTLPIDAAIIGIVDAVNVDGQRIFSSDA